MFNKLRNKLILINFGITTLVIVAVFTMIYMISVKTAENRPPKMIDMPANLEIDIENIINSNIRQEKESAAQNLLITLISSGIAIEIVVVLISYFMAEEAIKPVREAYEAQKIFIANASHEIKTPLAAISANLEAADIHDNKWIYNVEVETAKLTKLNNDLLGLARTDLMEGGTTEEIELKDLVNRVLDGFEPRLSDKKLVRKINCDKKVKINPSDFEQILSILMDNAIKYSAKKITVELDRNSLMVSNDGAKIPVDKLPHVFDRFYQVDKSSDGVGLGLSIAKSLADKNHYKLSVKSNKLTTFLLVF